MDRNFDTLFSDSWNAVSEGLRFLAPSGTKAIDFHHALFASLNRPAQEALYKELVADPGLTEKVFLGICRVIDPEGYKEYSGTSGDILYSHPDTDAAVKTVLKEAATLQARYPLFIGKGHPLAATEDNEFLPSIETIITVVLSCLGRDTATAISACASSLLLRTYDLLAKEKGYDDLADAERALDAAAYDAEFTDALCSGEG